MGNPVGRPPKYKTPEDLQAVIDQYFYDCKRNRLSVMQETDPPDDVITDDEYPTVSGLGLAIGMCRQSLINYSEKDDFLDTIKKARSKLEAFLEQRLFLPQPTGVIFNLKNNYGWKDKQEFDHQSTDGSMKPVERITIEVLDAPKNTGD